jgi:hypothetical protein
MGSLVGGSLSNVAVLNGGPMDGQEHPVESGTAEFRVVMTDGQQHLYEGTNQQQVLPDGCVAWVFEWKGRYFGPT